MQYRVSEVNITLIKVNAMDRGAGLHLSSSSLHKRFTKTKKTQGFGENSGDRNAYMATVQSINDDDLFDMNSIFIRD